MKKLILKSAFAFIAVLLIFSCSKKDETVPVPVINLTELGYDNTKTGIAGSDLHMEAGITAEGKIDKVTVEIHTEEGHISMADSPRSSALAWAVDTTYTEFRGLKNTTFHKHLEIPADATPGHYHFHFIVTDQQGQQSAIEEEIEILLPSNENALTTERRSQ
jgi:hypothetical protein